MAIKLNTEDALGIGCGIITVVIVVLISVIVGAVCWPYTINTWLVYAGKPPQLLWWHGALIGFVPGIGQLSIPLAVATWLLMMFIQ